MRPTEKKKKKRVDHACSNSTNTYHITRTIAHPPYIKSPLTTAHPGDKNIYVKVKILSPGCAITYVFTRFVSLLGPRYGDQKKDKLLLK